MNETPGLAGWPAACLPSALPRHPPLTKPQPHNTLYKNRTPEELLTQKIWRLRVKFLFPSPSVTAVKVQSLSLCFDKLTRRSTSTKAAFNGGVPVLLGAPSGSGKPHLYRGRRLLCSALSAAVFVLLLPLLGIYTYTHQPPTTDAVAVHPPHPTTPVSPQTQQNTPPHNAQTQAGGSASTVTSTTASLSTTPTGTCTPSGSDTSLCEDVSELSLQGSDAEGDLALDMGAGSSTRSADTARRRGGGSGSASGLSSLLAPLKPSAAAAAAPMAPPPSSSSASVSSARSGGSSSSGSQHRRRTTGSGCSSSSAASSSDRAAVRQLLAVIDQVLAGRGGGSAALASELTALRARMVEHLEGERRLSDEDMTRAVARIGSLVQALAASLAGAAGSAGPPV